VEKKNNPFRCEVCGTETEAPGRCAECDGWLWEVEKRHIDGRVYRVPVVEVGVDPSVYQFKRDVNAAGVSEEYRLRGEWNEAAAGLLLLFEDGLGRLWVANGHHRLDHARRCAVRTVNALIMREIDGYAPADARRIAAEANILDGKGTDLDHAEYFRHTRGDKSYYGRSGLISRGWVIGTYATDNTYGLFKAGRLPGECAQAVSGAAPNDESLQSAGAEWCLKNPRAKGDEARAYVEALMVVPRQSTQSDLFGFDDSALVAAESLAGIVREIRGEIRERITAVQSAARRPEIARREGVDVKDPQGILERVKELRAELGRWIKWYVDPDLTAIVKERAKSAA